MVQKYMQMYTYTLFLLNTEYKKTFLKDQWWKVNKTAEHASKENTCGSPVQSIYMQVYYHRQVI